MWTNVSLIGWDLSDFLHQSQLLMREHFEKKNRLKGPTLLYIRVGPLKRNSFFQNAHSSGVATDVESKIPPNQTDIGPHKKSRQG